jgi:D-alanine--poly(phosphoribitol) ligase subunit 2
VRALRSRGALVKLRDQLEGIFRDVLNVELPSPDTDILEAGILDSLAFVTLLFEIEERFGVRIPLDQLDLEDIRTVDRISLLIEALLLKAGAPASELDRRVP